MGNKCTTNGYTITETSVGPSSSQPTTPSNVIPTEVNDNSNKGNPSLNAQQNQEAATEEEKGKVSNHGEGMASAGEECCEAVVCDVEEIQEGEMREVDLGHGKALLIKDGGEFHAIGNKCTHYGAPLVKGALCNGHVRCPWHGACFNIRTGDIEDFPGLDSIQKFDVEVSDGKVKIKADKSLLAKSKRQRHMCPCAPEDKRNFVIVGGGAASVTCAETLRHEGYSGRITLVTKEGCIPYDRPKLSKVLDIKPEQMALRDPEFYTSNGIEIKCNKEAVSVDPTNKTVKLNDGEELQYDKLLIATGGSPRSLPIPGNDLENVCLLRTPEDGKRIADQAKGRNVVIIGTSFIGMEVASAVVSKANSVTSVDLVDIPFKLVLGDKVGEALKKLHEEKGTKFIAKNSAKEFVGKDGKVEEVVLQDDTRLPADLVVIGIGVFPTTAFLKGSGIDISDRGFVNVDKKMKTNIDDVYAAGDIVQFPLFINENQQSNVQHWQMAHAHGRIAAKNMVGQYEDIHSVPFFWTQQFGKSLRYTGYGLGYDDVIINGNPEELKFVAYYTKGERVIAVASMNMDPIVAQAAEYMLAGKCLTKQEVRDNINSWVQNLNK